MKLLRRMIVESTRLLKTTIRGAPFLFLLIYPVVFGAIAFGALALFGVHRKTEIALAIGYGFLALLPCYILGEVFLAVKKGDPRWEAEDLPKKRLGDEELLEIWKKCVDVQMHFNGIELQIRNYAVTLLVAVIGAVAYALKERVEVNVSGHTFSIAVAILPAGILGWTAFYFMDRHWYHRLLLGSVQHAARIEKAVGPELELGDAISKASPIPICEKKIRSANAGTETVQKIEIRSSQRIDLFYAAGLTFLIVLLGFLLLQGTLFTISSPAK